MNFTRVLNNALPDIPARNLSQRPPRMDPGTTFREHIEDGKPIMRVYVPCNGGMFKLPPANWKLAQLFDGNRSYEEIADLYTKETGVQYDTDAVREFAANLEVGEFWFKTPQEKNILLLQQSTEERRKILKGKNRWADLSEITFPAFNPDRVLNWLYGYTEFFYSSWFTILTLMAFAVTAGITITHWREIGRDTLEFYNFTNKTWGDVAALYIIGMFVVAVHEFAHAHACKHCGGRVPAMGFALIYLTPAFYTDTTEGAVTGTRNQRIAISVAGVWSEMMLCAIATPIWWGTPPDTPLHNGAYFMMMLTGIMSLVVNWNPLMKLDGYYILCELLAIPDLKEDSTAYVSALNKKYIWRLPVEVQYVPKGRRLGFAVYAILSGLYSYSVLYFFAGFAGNIVRNFSPEWGFLPELGVAALIFRSRIRLLGNFMKFVYLDKKDRIRAWFTSRNTAVVGCALAILLLLPVWRDSVSGKFILEAANSSTVRVHVPGVVTNVFVKEGSTVVAGEPLAKLRNLPLMSELDRTRTRLQVASERANAAELHYSDYGAALAEREESLTEAQLLSSVTANLELTSPISGTVMTGRIDDLLGSYLRSGEELLEVADLSRLRARIYVSEFDLPKIHPGAPARLQVKGFLRKWDSKAELIAPRPTEMDARMLEPTHLKGMNLPHFYLVDLYVENPDGRLKPGATGVARIYGERRSLLSMGWEMVSDFFGRKVW